MRNKIKAAQRMTKYYIDHKEIMRDRAHTLEFRRHKTELRDLRKARVLTHYGNGNLACIQCDEHRLACLTLDHINNDGAEHRKLLHKSIYLWAEQNNYPSGFQTLCWNCQWVKKSENERARYNMKNVRRICE